VLQIPYKCQNSDCSTNYYTVPPQGVELYARVHREVKAMVFRWFFHLRGSLSRVRDELCEHGIFVSSSTVARWIKKAGEECVDAFSLFEQEDWEQPLCIDEKWVKVRKKWCYAFTAVGTKVADLFAFDLFYQKEKEAFRTFLLYLKLLGFDLFAFDLFYQKEKEAFRTFLLYLKLLGFRPKIITTDLLIAYENVIKEVFPDCYHHQCVLHAERDAKRLVRVALGDIEKHKEWEEKLVRRIRTLLNSRKEKQLKKRYFRLLQLKKQAPKQVSSVFDMLEKYYPKLLQAVIRKDIPKTTNAAERAIGEFEERYHLTKGFSSFYWAQFFLKSFQVYYRLRKISFGPLRGYNRFELKGNPLGKLNFTEYLTPTYF